MPVSLVSQEELPGPLRGYRLIERLGRGGFGEVWKVEAPGGLLKAVKFVFGDLDAADEDSRPAEQELKALKRVREIRHPYILSLERIDTIDGQLIIVMELADRNLWDRYRECRSQRLPGIPRDELLRYMEESAEALDLMNMHYQIQHLDVKPQNLFLVFNHVKVGDFGLAKLLEGVRATVTGGVTPVYAAPETFEGWVSRFSDQYSLAIVFQELLTGTRPFNGANTRQLLMQHLNGTPDLSPLPLTDRPIIARALAKKPDDRWPSCAEMVRALKLAGLPPPPLTPPESSRHSPVHSPIGPLHSPVGPPPPGSAAVPSPSPQDSVLATRMVRGGSGRLGPDPTAGNRVQTPQPGGLPPLVKPAGNPPATQGSTPIPGALVGPRLVTPGSAAAGLNPAMTLNRPVVFQTARMGTLGIAPPEKTGDGVLFPTLIVALGQTGQRVVERYRRLVRERYGHPDKLPNVRVVHLDTDPEALPASGPDDPGLLSPRDTLIARLNRPAHYLQRDNLPPLDPWMPPGLLYRLARTPGAAGGFRAFGRLALLDNYRPIVQRLRQEIETFLTDGPLAEADKNTGLGLRTNRPRVYLLAGLGGGTGGGMFLDLAFLLRHELRQVGYLRPEVVGLFFVPPVDKSSARGTALGNTYAALAELYHFQGRKTCYQTAFDKSEAPVVDTEPPFARVVLLPLPAAIDPNQQATAAGVAARALFNETLTAIGRACDEVRAVYRKAFPTDNPTCQTFGLFRLSWPRPEMLTTAARRLAQRQLQSWTQKDSAHLREPVAAWLDRQWTERRLELESIVESLNAAVRDSFREDPDRVFDAFIDPLRSRTPSNSKFDAVAVCSVLDQLIKVVGKPDTENDPFPGSLHDTLTARFEQLLKDYESHLAVMAATFLEVPQFRLPGAEEAVRQIADRLQRQIDALEPVRAELDKEVRNIYGRLFQAIGTLSTAGGLGALAVRRAATTAEVLDLLRLYPRKRLQIQVLDRALSIYRKLHGNTPEYLRELGFCRSTLTEFHAALTRAGQTAGSAGDAARLILPTGCRTLDEAADRFLADLAPQDLLDFEQRLQKEITRQFRGLGSVCLKPVEKGPHFRELLLTRCREFLDQRLDHSDPATAFFRFRTDDHSAEPLIGEAFEEAAPELRLPPGQEQPYEFNILAAPPGETGDRLRLLTARVLPNTDLTAAPVPDDICFYRECPQIDLLKVPQLGEVAREAYQQMLASDHPPHARVDVPWQLPGT